MRISRARGLTLIELLMAVALTVVIVGIVAATTIQVQKTISQTMDREDVARQARAALSDMENDLARLVPISQAPAPPWPAAPPVRPLQIEAKSPTAPYVTAPRPTPYTDRMQLFTNVPDPLGSGVQVRALVEYSVSTTFATGAGGGPPTARLQKKIINWAKTGDTTTTTGPSGPLVSNLCDKLLSFQLEYIDPANATSPGSFVDPSPASASPSSTMGDIWVYSGTGIVGPPGNPDSPNYFVVMPDAGATPLFNALGIGGQIQLTTSKTLPGQAYLIRKKAPPYWYLNDRVDPLSVSPTNSDALANTTGTPGYSTVAGFVGPPMIRATLTFVFGRGVINAAAGVSAYETARFSRNMVVPQ